MKTRRKPPLFPTPEPDRVLALRQKGLAVIEKAVENQWSARRQFESAVYGQTTRVSYYDPLPPGMRVAVSELPVDMVLYGRSTRYGYHKGLTEKAPLFWWIIVETQWGRCAERLRIRGSVQPIEHSPIRHHYGTILVAQSWEPHDPTTANLRALVRTIQVRRALVEAATERT